MDICVRANGREGWDYKSDFIPRVGEQLAFEKDVFVVTKISHRIHRTKRDRTMLDGGLRSCAVDVLVAVI